MPRSQANNRIFPLVAGGTFTGTAESTAAGVAISVSVLVPTECTLTIEQSYDKATWFISEQYPIPANAHKTVQQAVGLEYFRVILLNNGITQTFCHLISTLSTSLTQNVNIRNLEAARDTVDISGNVEVNFPAVQVISGTVAVSSQPALSYLTDNVAVATLPPITGTVAVSSQPALSYLTDNVAVATLPPITGTVAVSSQPHLSYLTDNVAVATQPALAFSTDKVDATGSSVSISSAPYLSKTTSSIDISGQSVVVSSAPHLNKTTDSVDISGQTVVTSRITSSVTTFENNASIITFPIITTTAAQQIKDSAGSLVSINYYNDSNAVNYLLLYNDLSGNVVIGTTPTVAVLALKKADSNHIPLHSVYFSTAISVVAAGASDGSSNPSGTGVFVTALYDG